MIRRYNGPIGSFSYDTSQFAMQKGHLIYHGKETDGSKIKIPQGVKDISNTFAGSKLVTPPVIPETVVSMNGAFMGCTSLEKAPAIPNSVITMIDAFKDCPCEQKRQEAIKEHREQKKDKTGLDNPVISASMGGAVKSPYVPDAGIRVLSYDASLPLDKILRDKQSDIAMATGDIIGEEETGKETFVVGKTVVIGDKAYLPMLYSGFTSENEGQIDDTIRYMVEHTLKDSKLPNGNFVERSQFALEDKIYRPTESQVQNAIERYTTAVGTWVGKNVDKPIKLDTSLLRNVENDMSKQNEGNGGLG